MRRKGIRQFIILLLLIAAGVVVAVRWNAWFGNPAESAYIVGTEPENLMLTLGEKGDSERVLSWRCDTALHTSYVCLTHPDGQTETIQAAGEVVESRAGKAAFYHAPLCCPKNGTYSVVAHTCKHSSNPYIFTINAPDSDHEFAVLGDIQATTSDYSQHVVRSVRNGVPNAEFWVQVGDLIERPCDNYWQLAFSALKSDTLTAFVAATGNHEYLKGIRKTLDSRWTSVFVNPHNGPHGALGRTYYVDYNGLRLIVLDTDGLFYFSDYTRTEAWLFHALTDTTAADSWKMVVMHHPARSAGMGRDNPLIFAAFARALSYADVVVAGHDHSYARRIKSHKYSNVKQTVSYVISTSDKHYLPKLNKRDDRLLSCHPHYLKVRYNSNSLEVATYLLNDNTLYDRVLLSADTTAIDYFEGVGEIIEMPQRYKEKNNWKTRLFKKRLAERS